MDKTSHDPDLGYVFHKAAHPGDPGSPRLDIILRSEPTGRHFDPRQAQFAVVSLRGDIEQLHLEHPWQGSDSYRVCAGRIILRDHREKTVEAFTFGGELSVRPQEEHTTASLTSPAPILNLAVEHTLAGMLAEQVEILLAERRAALASDLERYEKKLAEVDPLALYHSCLEALREKFRHFPPLDADLGRKFTHFLQVESHSLHEAHRLPAQTTPLDELL